jgi:hypothetical protein
MAPFEGHYFPINSPLVKKIPGAYAAQIAIPQNPGLAIDVICTSAPRIIENSVCDHIQKPEQATSKNLLA